jgi:hypothetical protein
MFWTYSIVLSLSKYTVLFVFFKTQRFGDWTLKNRRIHLTQDSEQWLPSLNVIPSGSLKGEEFLSS